jgi:site-specific recombinase XerD
VLFVIDWRSAAASHPISSYLQTRCRTGGNVIHTINLTPERDALDGRLIAELIRLWLADCRCRLPAYTVDGYADKVQFFEQWWREVGPWRNHELDESTFNDFKRWLQGAAVSAAGGRLSYHTCNDVLRRLRQCLRWASNNDHTARDFSKWVPKPDGGPRKRRAAKLDALIDLLSAAAQSTQPVRDQALLALLIQTGIRRAECSSIQLESISMAADCSGRLVVTGKRTAHNPTGERQVAFDQVAGAYLATYLDSRELTPAACGPLFVSGSGAGLTPQGVAKVVTRLIRKAGLADQIQGCHDLRRAWVTDWRRRYRGDGYDHLMRLQVGHASAMISDMYDLADTDDLQRVMRGPLSPG